MSTCLCLCLSVCLSVCQFVELKGSVFKKFEKHNLFQMSCSDVRERFHLLFLLTVVGIRNLTDFSWNMGQNTTTHATLTTTTTTTTTVSAADIMLMSHIKSNSQLTLVKQPLLLLCLFLKSGSLLCCIPGPMCGTWLC